MTEQEQFSAKKALEILDKLIAGVVGNTLIEMTSIAIGHPLTTVDGQRLLNTLTKREWAYTYTNAITEQVLYAITDAGRVAMLGL